MKCLNNLHQLGLGMQMYINNNNGHFPFTYHDDPTAAQMASGSSGSWITTIGTYCENVDDMRLCPDDPLEELRVDPNTSGIRGTSYVINEYVAVPPDQSGPTDGYAVLNINYMRDTHSLVVLFEGADTRANATEDHAHCSQWYATQRVARPSVAVYFKRGESTAALRLRELSVCRWPCLDSPLRRILTRGQRRHGE